MERELGPAAVLLDRLPSDLYVSAEAVYAEKLLFYLFSMIAIGGAVGTGLIIGSGTALVRAWLPLLFSRLPCQKLAYPSLFHPSTAQVGSRRSSARLHHHGTGLLRCHGPAFALLCLLLALISLANALFALPLSPSDLAGRDGDLPASQAGFRWIRYSFRRPGSWIRSRVRPLFPFFLFPSHSRSQSTPGSADGTTFSNTLSSPPTTSSPLSSPFNVSSPRRETSERSLFD
jgi:hypothetical protein